MLLSVFTRHSTTCRFSRDRACRRCNCPKWVGGQVNGYYFRQSAKTRQWAEAEEVRVKLEEALIKGLPPFGAAVATGSAPPIPTQADPPPTSRTEVPEPRAPEPRPRVTVAQAVEAYLADAVSRSVETSTLKKLETIFRKQFLAWTRVEGIEYIRGCPWRVCRGHASRESESSAPETPPRWERGYVERRASDSPRPGRSLRPRDFGATVRGDGASGLRRRRHVPLRHACLRA